MLQLYRKDKFAHNLHWSTYSTHRACLCSMHRFYGRFSRVVRTKIWIPWNSILTLPKNCFTFNWKVCEETLWLNNLSKCLIYVILSNVNVPGWFKVKLYQGWWNLIWYWSHLSFISEKSNIIHFTYGNISTESHFLLLNVCAIEIYLSLLWAFNDVH